MATSATMKSDTGPGLQWSDENSALEYNARISQLREQEYPMLKDTTYLDHAGTTPPSRSLVEAFSRDMLGNLLGNPHSTFAASQRTSSRIDDVRFKVLRMFKAESSVFDIVFVANATAGIKLVAEAFASQEAGFWYGYHRDAHTSLIGARELAGQGSRCFSSDGEVEEWIQDCRRGLLPGSGLFAYPAQSNMNGRRLPLGWCRDLRKVDRVYTLLDAAALVSTSPLDLSDLDASPDFTVFSFYKIFGFPDLGAVIVRKDASSMFDRRRYFGGGTVDTVACLQEHWHMSKSKSLHERLEDGTLPIHSIVALDSAIETHGTLFGSLKAVSAHVGFLTYQAHSMLSSLRHGNGRPVCQIYKDALSDKQGSQSQGPIIAFNIRNSAGRWASNHEVQKLAAVQKIELRAGTLCNPGGMAYHLDLQPRDLRRFYEAGYRCDGENDIQEGKPFGMLRASFGAMSTLDDVASLIEFVRDFFVESRSGHEPKPLAHPLQEISVDSLSIYPIKSCGAWRIPSDIRWPIRREGLAWDREWCLVHQGTYATLSLKRFPRMALFRPILDMESACLRVQFAGSGTQVGIPSEISVPLALERSLFRDHSTRTNGEQLACSVGLCGDSIQPLVYAASDVHEFFSCHLRMPVYLARLPVGSTIAGGPPRLSKLQPRLPQPASPPSPTEPMPGAFPVHQSPPSPPPSPSPQPARPLLGSNESPILVVSASSLEQVNRAVVAASSEPVDAAVFRANIVLGSNNYRSDECNGGALAFAEDAWHGLTVSSAADERDEVRFDVLGPCRRCQVVCVDPETGARRQQPFTTLARTRKRDGGVWFGVHAGLALDAQDDTATIGVGDRVKAW